MAEEYHYLWEWNLRASPEALWPLVADTNRFNLDTGLPPVEQAPGGDLHNARRRLSFLRMGVRVEWEEEPFEWVRPYRFGVVRRYSRGPVREMRVAARLEPTDDGGTHLSYEVWAWPKGPLGRLALPIQIGFLSARAFDRAFRHYGELAAAGKLAADERARPDFVAGGRTRLKRARQLLVERGLDAGLVDRLVRHVASADALTLARMRPYVLADYWNAPPRDVLEVCLWATRAGMLDLQWDILCPLCRGDQVNAPTLLDVPQEVHCPTCNIHFDVNFEHLVELTFHSSPAIREVRADTFCVAGPGLTPHIEVQQLLPPGAKRVVAPVLEPGRYRLRAPELPGGQFLRVESGGLSEATLRASRSEGWPATELALHPGAPLRLENLTDAEQLFVLERLDWSDEAVTAAEVIGMQLFRDLFADEVLRPYEQISVGSVSILFTDLRGSTRMYREIGDAPAFGLVMDHFEILEQHVAAEGGARIKTMGDAVMAVFQQPSAALRAVLNANTDIAEMLNDPRPLVLKAGLHHGPCIAVTLNERLDYFGSTVNTAANLQALSSGGDVVVSGVVRDDPEVIAVLDDPRLRVEPLPPPRKGGGPETAEVFRIAWVG